MTSEKERKDKANLEAKAAFSFWLEKQSDSILDTLSGWTKEDFLTMIYFELEERE